MQTAIQLKEALSLAVEEGDRQAAAFLVMFTSWLDSPPVACMSNQPEISNAGDVE